MKSPFLKFLLFGLLIFQLACRGEDPTTDVHDLFKSYQDAIAQEQYEQASFLLDQKTAKLALRQNYSKKELGALDGRQVFSFAAKNKINALDSVQLYSIAKIVMDADLKKAAARMKRKNKLTDAYLKFNKEGGDWKVNFAGIMNESNTKQTSVEVSGIKKENKRAFDIIKNISDKRIKSNIWTPAKRW